jgi:hypothetical protein
VAAHFEHAEQLTTFQDDVRDLVRVLGSLRWRLGLERVLVFGVRGLGASAFAFTVLQVAAWLVPVANWTEPAWIAALPLLAALTLAVVRWPSDRAAALAADRRLALHERLGTAVELARRPHDADGHRFDRMQVRDAVIRARTAPHAWLTLDVRLRREALLALALCVLACVSTFLPGLARPGLLVAEPSAVGSDLAPAGAPALDRTAPALAELPFADTQAIQPADADLSSRVQQEQAERAALDSLAQAVGRISAGQAAADAIQRGDFSAARDQLANLGEEADQLSGAAKQQLSRALQQAANAAAPTDKSLAERERQAAQALSRTAYADQRQALRNLADQVAKSGARTATADQLARDVGRLQQQAATSAAANAVSATGAAPPRTAPAGAASSRGAPTGAAQSGAAQSGVAQSGAAGEQAGAGATDQPGGPGVGTGTNPDALGDTSPRLDTAGQRVEVPTKLGTGPGVRPPDGSEDQTGTDPTLPARAVAEQVQSQQTGQVAPEQNLVPGEQRPVVRGYFR